MKKLYVAATDPDVHTPRHGVDTKGEGGDTMIAVVVEDNAGIVNWRKRSVGDQRCPRELAVSLEPRVI